MTSLDPSATLVRALAPEPFDAFEVLMATLPGSAPARPLELARRRIAVLLDGEADSLGPIVELDPRRGRLSAVQGGHLGRLQPRKSLRRSVAHLARSERRGLRQTGPPC